MVTRLGARDEDQGAQAQLRPEDQVRFWSCQPINRPR
jgi:hypothetical protein